MFASSRWESVGARNNQTASDLSRKPEGAVNRGSRRAIRYAVILSIDGLLTQSLALFLAFFARFEGKILPEQYRKLVLAIPDPRLHPSGGEPLVRTPPLVVSPGFHEAVRPSGDTFGECLLRRGVLFPAADWPRRAPS